MFEREAGLSLCVRSERSRLIQRSSWSWLYGSWIYIAVQSGPITIKVVSSNLLHGELYSIQHHLITFAVSDLRQSVVFSRYSGFLHKCIEPPRYKWNIVSYFIFHTKLIYIRQNCTYFYDKRCDLTILLKRIMWNLIQHWWGIKVSHVKTYTFVV